MRFLPWVLAASVAVAGCGLDADGLYPSDGGGANTLDGMLGEDAASSGDASTTDATLSDSSSNGNDSSARPDADGGVGVAEAGTSDAPSDDATGNDATGDDDAAGEDASDTGVDSAPDTGADSAPADAGGADAGDACAAAEVCNNGIDDNCDGLVDCADPECTPAWTCTSATIPPGWTAAEYVEDARPMCSTGYGTSLDVVEGPSGAPASCACQCDVTSHGSCETGSFSVYVGGGLGCALLPSATGPANGGACSPTAPQFTPTPGTKIRVDPLGYTAGSCTPDPTLTVPDASVAGQGRLCLDNGGTGAGCANAGACVPAAQGGGFALCISHDGILSCPAGFPNAHTAGTAVADTRGCSPCTCGGATATCANATFTLFADGGCDDDGAVVVANSACNDFTGPTGGTTYVAYEYTATVQGEGCQATPGSPDGGVSLTKPHTVCCQ